MHSQAFVDRLGITGVAIDPDFLSPASLQETRADLDQVHSAGLFHLAGTGQGAGQSVRGNERNDETYWLDREHSTPLRTDLWARLDALKVCLNRTLFLGLSDFQGHYAAYPEGGFYRRHLDSFRDDDTRVVSFVLYLNQKWKSDDGGRLRIYETDGTHQDVNPAGGTLVCFLSREKEHEVLLSRARRFSLTGWFRVPRQTPNT